MDYIVSFFATNFILLCVSVVVIVNSVIDYKSHPRISIYSIFIISFALVLALLSKFEQFGKNIGNVPLTTICAYFGYTLRPVCIFFFIMMSGTVKYKRFFVLTVIPLLINGIIYALAFLPSTSKLVYYFIRNNEGGLYFAGGPLRFTSHVISALYLGYLLYLSLLKISSKHFTHGFAILGCSAFVVIAVIVESFFNPDGNIELLNSTIAVSCMFFYLYLYIEKSQIDSLTNVFNRDTYYRDIAKRESTINGVIQFDMNGLKYINDNFGHLEGDKALSELASVITKSMKKSMMVYRLGGDEFIALAQNTTEGDLIETVKRFKNNISKTQYRCSVGYAFKKDKNASLTDLIKAADDKMYHDKKEFYKNSKFDRRAE